MPRIMTQPPIERLAKQAQPWMRAVRAMRYRGYDLTPVEAALLTKACFARQLPASAIRVQDYQLTIHLGTEVD